MSVIGEQIVADGKFIAEHFEATSEDSDMPWLLYVRGFVLGLTLGSREPAVAAAIMRWVGQMEPWKIAADDQWVAGWRELVDG